MKFLIGFLYVLGYLAIYVVAESNDSSNGSCKAWKCQSGLGGDQVGQNRTCASDVNLNQFTEQCRPDDHLCNVQPIIVGKKNCTHTPVFPWKKDMPAGDSCVSNDECYSRNCTSNDGKKTCVGKGQNSACTDDRECNAKLFCFDNLSTFKRTCQPVIKVNGTCDGTKRCEFGAACANNVCTRFGTLRDGTLFNITDNELYPGINDVSQQMFRVCKSFWAIPNNTRSKLGREYYECSPGPVKDFDDYSRSDGDLSCTYTVTTKDGRTRVYEHQARCGYNNDDSYYCPKMRGGSFFEAINLADQAVWGTAPSSCHHRSTIQYCRAIEDNPARSFLFRNFLRYDWETTDVNWAYIANHDRCVGNAITNTRAYWRIRDSAVTSTFSILAFAFLMSYLY